LKCERLQLADEFAKSADVVEPGSVALGASWGEVGVTALLLMSRVDQGRFHAVRVGRRDRGGSVATSVTFADAAGQHQPNAAI
jgi:hypothetical protein